MEECYHRDYTHGVDPKRLPCKTGVVRSRESTTDNPDDPLASAELDLDRIRRAAKTSGTAILCDALEACRAERDEALAAVADCKEKFDRRVLGAVAAALLDRRALEAIAASLDRRALDAIAALLDGAEWEADVLDEVAGLVRDTGRDVGEIDGYEDDVEDYDIKTGTYCECGAKYDPELPGYECAR